MIKRIAKIMSFALMASFLISFVIKPFHVYASDIEIASIQVEGIDYQIISTHDELGRNKVQVSDGNDVSIVVYNMEVNSYTLSEYTNVADGIKNNSDSTGLISENAMDNYVSAIRYPTGIDPEKPPVVSESIAFPDESIYSTFNNEPVGSYNLGSTVLVLPTANKYSGIVDMGETIDKSESGGTSSGYTYYDSGYNANNKYGYYIQKSNSTGTKYWNVYAKGKSKTYIKETITNRANLNSYADLIDEIISKEAASAASVGGTVLSLIVALLTAAPETLGITAIIALILGAGLLFSAAYQAATLWPLYKKAYKSFGYL